MRFRLSRRMEGGFMGPRTEIAVVELADGEAAPEGAVEVAPETPLHDWEIERPE